MSNLSSFIKYNRKKQGLTQEELAAKAGVGIRFVRELEQGKETVQVDKVNQVLALFGFSLVPGKDLDPQEVFAEYFNKAVKLTLRNKMVKYGILVKEITDPKENKIIAWQFVTNNNAIKYQQKPDEALTETISHSDIQSIEEQ